MDLAREVGRSLRQRGLTLALAESVTGGLAGELVTDAPGSSDYFLGGVVAYSNASKVRLLGVRERTLRSRGAVSRECAREMARGAREAFAADIGAACTGIAGPAGATRTKPIGLVFLAVDDGQRALVEESVLPGDRQAVRRAAAERLLELVLLFAGP